MLSLMCRVDVVMICSILSASQLLQTWPFSFNAVDSHEDFHMNCNHTQEYTEDEVWAVALMTHLYLDIMSQGQYCQGSAARGPVGRGVSAQWILPNSPSVHAHLRSKCPPMPLTGSHRDQKVDFLVAC